LPSVVPGYPEAVGAWLADRHGVHVSQPAFTERPTEPLAPAAWWESVWAQGIALLVLLAGFAGYGLFALLRSRGTRSARWLAGLGTLTVAGFVGLLGWAESSGMKNLGPVVFGRPLSWMVLQLLAVATVVALVGMLVRRRGTLVPVIAGIVFLPWAFYWGLLVP